MRSRLLFGLIIAGILLSTLPLFAQDAIPVFPGSKAEFELNLTQKDFLPVIRQWIGVVPGAVGGFAIAGADQEDAEDAKAVAAIVEQVGKELQSALAGVNGISVVSYRQPSDVSADKITDFYAAKMSLDKGWTRTLMIARPEGAVQLYVKPDLMSMFALGVGQGYVAAAKIDGKIDLVALGQTFAKYAPMIASHFNVNIGGPTGGDVETPEPVQAGYQVILNAVGPQRIRVLEAIREVTCMTPTEAREFVESLPQPLAEGLSKEEADDLSAYLSGIGAEVEVKNVE